MSTPPNPTPTINPLFGGSSFMGICYSPYHQEASKLFGSYTQDDVKADMELIAQNFSYIRTYTVQYANQYNVQEANAQGLQVALGAWIFDSGTSKGTISPDTQNEIATVIQQASQYPDTVKCIVIGNEIDIPKGTTSYTPSQVATAIAYAKTERAKYSNIAHIPITTCTTGAAPGNADWKCVFDKCETYLFMTIYPYYAPSPDAGDIKPNMQYSYNTSFKPTVDTLKLTPIIAEIGWPSEDEDHKYATVDDEKLNFYTTYDWINGKNIYCTRYVSFWFEMFDEPWKGSGDPNNREANWGLYNSGASPTAKFTIPDCR